MTLLDELNPGQRDAATTIDGPVLILAGAGTGKTRAITYRIANLIDKGVPGSAILAMTFTNKAAGQMKERVRDLLVRKGLAFDDPWIGTFHSFSAWLLRREATRLGLPRDFKIYDADDQTAVVKLALEHINIKDPGEKIRGLLERISFAKNHGLTPAQVASDAARRNDPMGLTASKVYEAYEKILRKAGALDFDDLLLRAVQVLKEFPEARAAWQKPLPVHSCRDECIRTPTGCSTICCGCWSENRVICASSATRINRSTGGAALTLATFCASTKIIPAHASCASKKITVPRKRFLMQPRASSRITSGAWEKLSRQREPPAKI